MQKQVREDLLKSDPNLVGTYDEYIKRGGNAASFNTLLKNEKARGAFSTLATLEGEASGLLESGVASQDVWSHATGGANSEDGYSVDVNGANTRVTDNESFGLKTLNALNDLQSGIGELNKMVPLDDLALAVQVAVMGPAAFALDYAKGVLVNSVAGDYIQAGVEKFSTILNAGAHATDVGTAEFLLGNRVQFEDQQWNALDQPGNTAALTNAERLLSLNEDFTRSQSGATLLGGILLGTTGAIVATRIGSGRQPTGDSYSVAYETKLSPNSYPGFERPKHFQEANESLLKAMEADTDFAKMMGDLGVKVERTPTGLAPRTSPDGWTWHHAQEPGVMQLVPRPQHAPGSIFQDAFHPDGVGGYSIWGK